MAKKRKSPSPSEETVDDGPQKKNARPSCSVDGCNNNAVVGGGICRKHGGKQIKKKCSVEGCEHHSRNNGVCCRHGSKQITRSKCSVGGCDKQSWKRGVCYKHQSMANLVPQKKYDCPRCSIDGCSHSAAGGGICIKHGGKRIKKKCSDEGCTNQAQKGGACMSHDGIKKKCSVDGCSSYASRLGFCWRHAPKEQCSFEGCDNITIARGCCRKHANSNIHSKESNNFSTNDADSDHQPQNGEQEGPLVCLPAVKRVNKKSNHCVTQDQAAMNREDDTTYYESESKRAHSNENQVCKNQTTVSSDHLESEEEEELGALIYKSSRTAKMIAESNLSKTK